MVKLCMIMHHITLYTLCIVFMLVSHTCTIAIGHTEQGPEEMTELAPVEGINPEQDQGSPSASNRYSLSYFYPFIS
jgi:hypothetical protein